uniref:Uncharacterized protein n=1 Tax=Poecilia reticulata TaxID=8081 RepID=A0A3P9N5L7_POERE
VAAVFGREASYNVEQVASPSQTHRLKAKGKADSIGDLRPVGFSELYRVDVRYQRVNENVAAHAVEFIKLLQSRGKKMFSPFQKLLYLLYKPEMRCVDEVLKWKQKVSG